MQSLFDILMILLNVAQYIIIAHIIMSWLLIFGVLNGRQPLVAQIWQGLNALLEPIYAPIRRMLPRTGGLDLAPLIVILAIIFLQVILANNRGFFYQ